MTEENTSNSLERFNIGSIVSLKTNFLKSRADYSHIWLAGEPDFSTPLMVVVEISINTKEKISERTGVDISHRKKYNYKCSYFSNKTMKFEENWFFHEELSPEYDIDAKVEESIKYGTLVVFKTNKLEVEKRKSYLEQENKKTSRKSSSLLHFSSPVFVVTGSKAVEKKEGIFDPVTREERHIYPTKMVKVKFFNTPSDKFSELLVPIETLKLAEIRNKTILKTIIALKKDEKIGYLETEEALIVATFDSVLFVSDDYIINYTDLFTKEESSVRLSEVKLAEKIVTIKLGRSEYPIIKESNDGFIVEGVESYIEELKFKQGNKAYTDESPIIENLLFLKYTNRAKRYTERYVIPLYVITVQMSEDEDEKKGEDTKSKTKKYLKAFCMLRNDFRFFLVDNILSIEEVDSKEMFKAAVVIFGKKTEDSPESEENSED